MLDQKVIDEIVRRVIERLLADSRFQSLASNATGVRPPSIAREHHGRLLSEWDVLKVHRSGGRAIRLSRSVIVTPSAKDRSRDLGVELIFE